jgi:DNA invertase Pin-like site-specific DNA recombinase
MTPSPQSGRLVGYARVSTDDQNLSLQLDALTQHGVGKDLFFSDKLSGAKDDRPGLGRCLKALKTGDTLVVWRLDRLGRSMRHLVTLIGDLREQGIGFRSISDGMIVLPVRWNGAEDAPLPRGLGRSARRTWPKRRA